MKIADILGSQQITETAEVIHDDEIEIIDRGSTTEHFADGKGPGRPGDSQRHGIPKNATMAELKKAARSKGRKGQLARWQINMRQGRRRAGRSGK
jgi:ribosomal protein L3